MVPGAVAAGAVPPGPPAALVSEPASGRDTPGAPVAFAAADGTAHWVNGARGPPVTASATAPRQTASMTATPNPAIRSARWRLPDGSAKIGPSSTGGSVPANAPSRPENAAPQSYP